MSSFTVFDVGHGSCALAVADNGEAVLIDCGHKSEPEWRPSAELRNMGINRIGHLFVTNFDEDHVSDLPGVVETLVFENTHFYRNRSIEVDQLRVIKQAGGPITTSMNEALAMHERFVHEGADVPVPGITWQMEHNNYPDFTDTNNLSLVVFLAVGGTTILLPGDLERAGWEALVAEPDFLAMLQSVDVFVASHHGRENGYCPDVFGDGRCQPRVIVFSDSEIKHATQEMASAYAQHASGVTCRGQERHVLSARRDGHLRLI